MELIFLQAFNKDYVSRADFIVEMQWLLNYSTSQPVHSIRGFV